MLIHWSLIIVTIIICILHRSIIFYNLISWDAKTNSKLILFRIALIVAVMTLSRLFTQGNFKISL